MISDIESLRTAAKRLKKAFQGGEPNAIRRAEAVLASKSGLKHADFLHIIARENGHESWPKLKFILEAAAMSREQKEERLKNALYFGQQWVVRKLLQEDPRLADANLGLQIALYNLGAVKEALQDPAKATAKIGIRTPILHLAFSKYIHMAPEKRDDMLAIAALLLENGADPNDGYPPESSSDHKLSALYGALGHANNMALASCLLDHGASPDDNESLYHATELGHHDGLKLLIKHGVKTRGTNALPRALDFNDYEAVRLLLEHGANPNEAVKGHPSGEPIDSIPALHQAARRWCSSDIAELLLKYGADPDAVWLSHTAYAMAKIYGNDDIAQVLEKHGASTQLTASEEALAECAAGRVPSEAIAAQILPRHDRTMMTQIAFEPSRLNHLKALIAAGFDPNATDGMKLTPLHAVGWAGLPDQVAFLLTLKPDLTHRNAYGGDALGTIIHGSEHHPEAAKRDHIACARLLLEAGAELRQEQIDGADNEEMAAFLEAWQLRSEP